MCWWQIACFVGVLKESARWLEHINIDACEKLSKFKEMKAIAPSTDISLYYLSNNTTLAKVLNRIVYKEIKKLKFCLRISF